MSCSDHGSIVSSSDNSTVYFSCNSASAASQDSSSSSGGSSSTLNWQHNQDQRGGGGEDFGSCLASSNSSSSCSSRDLLWSVNSGSIDQRRRSSLLLLLSNGMATAPPSEELQREQPEEKKTKAEMAKEAEAVDTMPKKRTTKKAKQEKEEEKFETQSQKSLREERKAVNRRILVASVFMIVLYTVSDNFLYLADVASNIQHRWFPLFLRACVQLCLSIALSLYYKKLPWGGKKALPLNIVLTAATFAMLFLISYSFANFTQNNSVLMMAYTMVAPAVYIFVSSTAQERFLVHRVILLGVVTLAAVVITYPKLFVSFPIKLDPLFTLDITFGFPMGVARPALVGPADLHTPNSFVAIMAFVLSPIMSAYVVILANLQRAAKGSHTTSSFWMGVGALLFVVEEHFRHHGIDLTTFSFPSSGSFISYSIANAVIGSLATELFLYILTAKSPNLATLFRYTELALLFFLQASYGLKGFNYHDLFAFALIMTSTAHCVVELLFYRDEEDDPQA